MPRSRLHQPIEGFDDAVHTPGGEPRRCAVRGCEEEATHPAPRSRDRLRDYIWLCLEHVRQYNATWNYYQGMSDDEVERDVRADTVWRRPTWRLGDGQGPGARGYRIHDGFADFVSDEPAHPAPPPSPAEEALAVLGLTPPVTVAVVKARYKVLVKRHHPDANGGDKAAEETFKVVNEAYRTLMAALTP